MLIPSIDLQGGRVVQLVQGETLAVEAADPEPWLARFARFQRVQLIDLDAAKGEGDNAELVAMICARLPCRVGGGIRSIDRAEVVLEAALPAGEVTRWQEDHLRRSHGGDVPAAFERSVRVTLERRQFWAQFCDVPELSVDTASILRDWKAAREGIAALLVAKQASPLDAMTVPSEVQALVDAYERRRDGITDVNRLLREASGRIALVKEGAAGANVAALTDDIARLKATKARHSTETPPLCEDYLGERTAKEATERERDQKKSALAQHRATGFPRYQASINQYLQRFNAGFRLDSVAFADTRGGPTCYFNVLINNLPVPVGAGTSAPGDLSFRKTPKLTPRYRIT